MLPGCQSSGLLNNRQSTGWRPSSLEGAEIYMQKKMHGQREDAGIRLGKAPSLISWHNPSSTTM